MVTMVFILGECSKNCLLASREYAARYPDAERKPRTEDFKSLLERFELTGNVRFKKRKVVNKTVNNEENQLAVLLCVQENPQVSTEQISRNTGISKTSVKRTLKEHKYHGYHLELHQELYDRDFAQRVTFCNWMINKITQVPDFLNLVLFSDEATFKSNGLVNRHNMHYYSTTNPHWVRHVDQQNRWAVNVWAGILGPHVIGPYFFENHLTGEVYLNFLRNELPRHLQHMDIDVLGNFWFQHDGAPPHYHADVRNFLNIWKNEKWIGRGGPVAWPPRSPDITPLDFYLWGYVKERVYLEVPTTAENMKIRIRDAIQQIPQNVMETVKLNFVKRLRKCIEMEGRTFEHLLRN